MGEREKTENKGKCGRTKKRSLMRLQEPEKAATDEEAEPEEAELTDFQEESESQGSMVEVEVEVEEEVEVQEEEDAPMRDITNFSE